MGERIVGEPLCLDAGGPAEHHALVSCGMSRMATNAPLLSRYARVAPLTSPHPCTRPIYGRTTAAVGHC